MIRHSVIFSRAFEYPWRLSGLFFTVVFLVGFHHANAQSSGCRRALATVDEVRQMRGSPDHDHRAILAKLETAKSLCPSLGEVWMLSHCSALALGNKSKAEIYRKRAVLGGVKQISCDVPSALSRAPPARKPLPSHVRQKFALVIGIGKFKDPAIPTLRYTAKDATDFADFLIEHGHFSPGNVTLLTDEQASRANILNGLQSLILKAQEEDLVVLYVSSHGSPSKQGSQGLVGIGYIVTHDSILKNIWVDSIEYQDFARKTSLIKARRLVAFLDTCFSGQAFGGDGAKQLSIEGVGVGSATAEMFLSGEGTYVVTSSRSDERSWESDRIENSYFTYFLIEALKRGTTPPSIQDIFEELSYKVTHTVAEDKGAGQHPQIHPADSGGDVRIGVIPKLRLETQMP